VSGHGTRAGGGHRPWSSGVWKVLMGIENSGKAVLWALLWSKRCSGLFFGQSGMDGIKKMTLKSLSSQSWAPLWLYRSDCIERKTMIRDTVDVQTLHIYSAPILFGIANRLLKLVTFIYVIDEIVLQKHDYSRSDHRRILMWIGESPFEEVRGHLYCGLRPTG
jgi:hypothetical protein